MTMTQNPNARIVALDVGAKRIGVASANVVARLATPVKTLDVSDEIFEDITQLLAQQTASAVVLGLPRGMQGQETEQTKSVQAFADKLQKHLDVPLYWQDEALTSKLSEDRLRLSGKHYEKGEVDALAATYILEDYLEGQPTEHAL
jgi:putative Holliday junction resolvase